MNESLLGAAEAARRIAAGQLSSEALVAECLARIDLREKDVRAWTCLDADMALEQARRCDAWRGSRGPLHGVPIGFKDVLDTVDLPTAYGSEIYAGHRPAWDAASVALARAAGAVVLGKTASTEFANIHPTITRNPHNLLHTPGGSSSGSAAAVADGMVPLAVGTQTAGSTIRPAAYCGIMAYKPTFGLISRSGLKLVAESLDTIGLFGRSIEDLALFMHALTGQSMPVLTGDVASAPRIGIYRPALWETAEPAARDLLDRAAHALSTAGARIQTSESRLDDPALDSAHSLVMGYESARAMTFEMRERRSALSAELVARLDAGLKVPLQRYQEALLEAAAARLKFEKLMHGLDIVITLSAQGEAPSGYTSTGNSAFNRIWTLLGLPCIHLPCTLGPNRLPLGIQVVGPLGRDVETLAHAHWISAHLASTDFASRQAIN